MNDLIKELSERVYDEYTDLFTHETYNEFSREKFAQLIIQECIEAVEDAGGINDDCHVKAIKRRFGIEED